jgi:hypothetical protein
LSEEEVGQVTSTPFNVHIQPALLSTTLDLNSNDYDEASVCILGDGVEAWFSGVAVYLVKLIGLGH